MVQQSIDSLAGLLFPDNGLSSKSGNVLLVQRRLFCVVEWQQATQYEGDATRSKLHRHSRVAIFLAEIACFSPRGRLC